MVEYSEIISLLLIVVAGISVGVLAGLFPALPTFTGPFLLYQFHASMSLTEMLVFWLTVYFGTQFFGSIATITTHIPGEESSLVYLDDIKKYSLEEKNHLLFDTALSSVLAALMALVVVWFVANYAGLDKAAWINSSAVQLLIYGGLLLTFIVTNRKRWALTLVTIVFGLSIAPKQNYALPELWYQWQFMFNGITFYLIMLGAMIIPSIFSYTTNPSTSCEKFKAEPSRNFKWWESIKASCIGIFAGLIPGPSASIGSIAAYNMLGGTNKKRKIIAAEAANNSAVVMSILPFLLLLMPLNQSAIIMAGIMDMQGIDVTEAIMEGSFVTGLSVLNLVLVVMFFVTTLYYILSTTFINTYVKIIKLLHGQIKTVLILLVAFLVYLDLQSADITVLHYFVMLSLFTGIGFVLQRFQVSTIPMMFMILLGDKLIWATSQLLQLYKII